MFHPEQVEDGFIVDGEFLPFAPCREHLEEVSAKLATLHGLSMQTVKGVLLLNISGIADKGACSRRYLEKYGTSCTQSCQEENSSAHPEEGSSPPKGLT